jgi:DNA-binding CsgD family transcriptional regulator
MRAATQGRSGVLIIMGEPGIGKSALLEGAARRAKQWTVLRASGTESEAELPFAGLSELLGPITAGLPQLPSPQSTALAGALALEARQPADHFTIYAATLSLLGWAATRRPVLVLIDDPQWLDTSSQNAIAFACRRLVAESIAVLVATRPRPASAFTQGGLTQLELGGLDEPSARRLLREVLPVAMPDTVAEELIATSAGNPLALREIARALSPGQQRGDEPLPDPLPIPSDLRALFLARVARLHARTRRALLLAAIHTGSPAELAQSLKEIGLAWEDLEQAVSAGIIDPQQGGRFTHPLVRAAVYHQATPAARRRAHRALARAAEASGSAARRAWHLAAAAQPPDPAAAGDLDQAAAEASARGAHAVAAATLEKAAEISPGRERLGRVMKAAQEHYLAGQSDRSLRLLDGVRAEVPDVISRAQVDHFRGRVLMARGPLKLAQQVLADSAATVSHIEPAMAAAMLTDAALACFMSGQVGLGEDHARRAWALTGQRADAPGEVTHMIFTGTLVMGGHAHEARHHIELERDRLLALKAAKAWQPLVLAAIWLMWAEESELVAEVLGKGIEEARRRSAPALLPLALAQQADLLWRRGDWTHAYASATEGAALARETGQQVILSYAEACSALALAGMGRDAECRAAGARAISAAQAVGSESAVPRVDAALGLLELGAGSLATAVHHLQQAHTYLRAHGVNEPLVVPCVGDLIEALIRTGRLPEAQAELEWLEATASATGRRWTAGVVHRLHGMLAPEDRFEDHLRQALSQFDQLPAPFEQGRTLLALGERLRRGGQRLRARTELRLALQRFEALGADPWVRRAGAELRATGETVVRRPSRSFAQLTPQELHVAVAVAGGSTNREIAASLFLSPKTIEYHLSNVYSKLGIRSRTELVRLIAGGSFPQN